jgi:hypothetical protein
MTKQEIMFRYLIAKMLRPHGITPEELISKKIDYRKTYTWTPIQRKIFTQEAAKYIKSLLPIGDKRSRQVAEAFVKHFGLNITNINNQKNE